jgi:hypothetical protein
LENANKYAHALLFLNVPSPLSLKGASLAECTWLRPVSYLYHEASHLQPASVRDLLVPMWLCEKVCQFTCERSVVSPHIHCIMYNVSRFSLPLINTDRHHITEKLLSMAKNIKQTNRYMRLMTIRYLCHSTLRLTQFECEEWSWRTVRMSIANLLEMNGWLLTFHWEWFHCWKCISNFYNDTQMITDKEWLRIFKENIEKSGLHLSQRF